MKVYSRGTCRGRDAWYIDYRFDGIRVRRRIGYGERGKAAAERKLAQIRAEIEAGTHQASKKTKSITFRDFVNKKYLEYLMKKRFYPKSGSFFAKHLVDHFGNTPMHMITYSMVEKYHESRSKDGPVAANRELSLLRAIFNKAEFWNQKCGYGELKLRLPACNPVRGIEFNAEESRRRFATGEEIKSLIEKAYSDKLRDIILLALNTGMRKGEIQNLSVKKHIDWNQNIIELPETKSKHLKRNGEIQRLPMNPLCRGILLKYKDEAEEFPFNYNFRKVFDNAMADAKISKLHFHDLRRTFAVLLRLQGVDIFTVSSLLRHSPPEQLRITAIYTPAINEELHNAVGRLELYFNDLLRDAFPFYLGTIRSQMPKSVSESGVENLYLTRSLSIGYGA